MSYHHGNTVCISSQVGCRMGCKFCASTLAGKVRDLTPSEMLDQVLFTQLDSGREISNIVLMGIGEPMDNRKNVLRFLELINHPDGMNIGMRHISLSTCGVVPGIDALAEDNLQLTLSVSLHAPDSATRSRIMPVNNAYDVEELFAACHRYFKKTGRRISFEYAMIDGVNDHDWQADLLAEKIHGMPGHVNLIPLNDVVESEFKPSKRVAAFQKRLESHGLTATVRRSLGGDIDLVGLAGLKHPLGLGDLLEDLRQGGGFDDVIFRALFHMIHLMFVRSRKASVYKSTPLYTTKPQNASKKNRRRYGK